MNDGSPSKINVEKFAKPVEKGIPRIFNNRIE